VPNLAANRSTARRWIQAEATVVSPANILTMPGNCTKCTRGRSLILFFFLRSRSKGCRAFRQYVTVHNAAAVTCSNSSSPSGNCSKQALPQGASTCWRTWLARCRESRTGRAGSRRGAREQRRGRCSLPSVWSEQKRMGMA
jgi:hypothetical protein